MDWWSNHLDKVAKEMLQGVIEKKQKVAHLHHIIVLLRIVTFTGFSLFAIYFMLFIVYPNEFAFGLIVGDFLNKPVHLVVLLLLFSIYWFMRFYQNKHEEAENEFHALRCEIIQKSADLWKSETEWRERYRIFEIIKQKYDINLFYEN